MHENFASWWPGFCILGGMGEASCKHRTTVESTVSHLHSCSTVKVCVDCHFNFHWGWKCRNIFPHIATWGDHRDQHPIFLGMNIHNNTIYLHIHYMSLYMHDYPSNIHKYPFISYVLLYFWSSPGGIRVLTHPHKLHGTSRHSRAPGHVPTLPHCFAHWEIHPLVLAVALTQCCTRR